MLLLVLTLCSAVAFLFYGYEALVADRVRREFERYGMPQFRVVIGSLQILGALGALAGLVNDMIGALATGGLMLMMLLGVVVRIRIHDAPRQMVQAASLAVLNGVLLYLHLT